MQGSLCVSQCREKITYLLAEWREDRNNSVAPSFRSTLGPPLPVYLKSPVSSLWIELLAHLTINNHGNVHHLCPKLHCLSGSPCKPDWEMIGGDGWTLFLKTQQLESKLGSCFYSCWVSCSLWHLLISLSLLLFPCNLSVFRELESLGQIHKVSSFFEWLSVIGLIGRPTPSDQGFPFILWLLGCSAMLLRGFHRQTMVYWKTSEGLLRHLLLPHLRVPLLLFAAAPGHETQTTKLNNIHMELLGVKGGVGVGGRTGRRCLLKRKSLHICTESFHSHITHNVATQQRALWAI